MTIFATMSTTRRRWHLLGRNGSNEAVVVAITTMVVKATAVAMAMTVATTVAMATMVAVATAVAMQ